MGRLLILAWLAGGIASAQSTVPFVGCKSDGQTGPRDAPKGKDRVLPISVEAAQRLAYYEAEGGAAVLGPRGWNCFALYGSSGSILYVTPQPMEPWSPPIGPEIVADFKDGAGSKMIVVAPAIARVFPAHWDIARAWKKETPDSFPFGPYPSDKLTYKSGEVVEFETPANADGLGFQGRLAKSDIPVRGVAILDPGALDLVLIATRLPPGLSDLAPIIIQQVERDAQKGVK